MVDRGAINVTMSNSTILDDGSNDAEQTSTFAVGGFVVVLAIISVVLRIYVRITTRVGLGWDDWFILASVVLTLLTAALLLWGKTLSPPLKRGFRVISLC